MRTFESVADLAAIKGESIGESEWVTISQEDVNLFADATGDHQWIHVDPERAAKGPFGKTIAHGFMTLALLPRLQHQMYTVNGDQARNQLRPQQGPLSRAGPGRLSRPCEEFPGQRRGPGRRGGAGHRVDHRGGRGLGQTGVRGRERRSLHRVGRRGHGRWPGFLAR